MKGLLTSLLLLSTSQLLAQTREEVIHSNQVGATPYLAVVSDPDGSSQRQAGLYVRAKDSTSYQPILFGQLLIDRFRGPIFDEFQLGEASARYDSLAILDGYLTFYSVYTNPADPKTFIQLSPHDGVKLFDPVTNEDVEVPAIRNLDDVSYSVSKIENENNHVLIFSLRYPSIRGDGLTFFVNLKYPKITSDPNIELENRPLVLDYTFRSSPALSRLLVKSKDHGTIALSDSLSRSLSREDAKDPAVLKKWKSDLRAGQNSLLSSRESQPGYDLKSGKKRLITLPSEKIFSLKEFKITQYFDPFGDDYVEVKSDHTSELMPGRVDRHFTENTPLIFTSSSNSNHALISINNSLFFVSVVSGKIDKILTFDRNIHLDQLSFVLFEPKETEHLLLISQKTTANQKTTTLYKFRNISNYFQLEPPIKINSYFYPMNELSFRTHHGDEDNILFDEITPQMEQLTAEGYVQSYDNTILHIDLTKSNSSGLQHQYVRPLETTTIGDKIVYKLYNDKKNATKKKTGLYIGSTNSNIYVPGEALPYKANIVWAEELLETLAFGKIRITVTVSDKNFLDGKNSSTANVICVSDAADFFPPQANEISFHGDIKDITYIGLIPGLKTTSNFTVFRALTDASGQKTTTATTFFIGFGEAEKRNTAKATPRESIKLPETGSIKELYDRIIYDQDGQAYFNLTPDLDYDDLNYQAINLADGRTINPGKMIGPKRLKFLSYYDAKVQPDKNSKMQPFSYNWRIIRNHLKAIKQIKDILEKGVSNLKGMLFPSFIDQLDFVAAETAGDQHVRRYHHKVLLVPDELKTYFSKMLWSHYLQSKGERNIFGRRNRDIETFVFRNTDPSDQADLIQLLNGIEDEAPRKNAILLVDAADLIAMNRISSGENDSSTVFHINDDQYSDDAKAEKVFSGAHGESSKTPPHALYWVATEGRRIDIEKFATQAQPQLYSTIILASESEWANLIKEQARLESSYGLVSHFELVTITAPNIEAQQGLIKEIFNSREVQRRDYTFSAKSIRSDDASLTQLEAQDSVTDYLISRVNSLSTDQNKNHLMALADVLHKMRLTLLQDDQTRNRKLIDRIFIEKVLAQVFGGSLQRENLAPDDWLNHLFSKEILLDVHNIGEYAGDFTLTRQVIETIKGQTRRIEARNIPASVVLFGETGTGKTSMFTSLVKTLGLQMYDWTQELGSSNNLSAQAFILQVTKLTDSESGNGLINVDKALARFEDALSGPNGNRMWILIDDAQGPNPKVRTKVLQRVRQLFDAEGGIVKVNNSKGEIVEFPSRNIVLFLTFNPTDNKKKIEQFKNSTYGAATPVEIAVASLGGEDAASTDKSFFTRWTLIKNMDEFPAEAKGPALTGAMVRQARDIFAQGQLLLVSNESVQKIVDEFQGMDARTFLSGAAGGIAALIDRAGSTNAPPLRIVVPATSANNSHLGGSKSANVSGEQGIIDFIAANSAVVPVVESIEGQLQFLKLVAQSFRTKIYEEFARALRFHPFFSGDEIRQSNLLAWSEQAIYDHVVRLHSNIPLSQINLDPLHFGAHSELERKDLLNRIYEIAPRESYFPKIFSSYDFNQYLSLWDSSYVSSQKRTRSQLNSLYVEKVKDLLAVYLTERFQLGSLKSFPADDIWARSMSAQKTDRTKDIFRKLAELLQSYLIETQSESIAEKQTGANVESLGVYDANRMFLWIIDRAIVTLPWSNLNEFVIKALSTSAQNMVIGQLSGLQDFLFEDRNSLLRPRTIDLLDQMLITSDSRKALSNEAMERVNTRFNDSCEKMLIVHGG